MRLSEIVNKINELQSEIKNLTKERDNYGSEVFFFSSGSGTGNKILYIPTASGCVKIDPSGYTELDPVTVCSNTLNTLQLRRQEVDTGYVQELTVAELQAVMEYIEELIKVRGDKK